MVIVDTRHPNGNTNQSSETLFTDNLVSENDCMNKMYKSSLIFYKCGTLNAEAMVLSDFFLGVRNCLFI